MLFKYLGRQYNIEAAWKLIEEGRAELVTLTDAQVQALKTLPAPDTIEQEDREDSDDLLVLVRDAIPNETGPPEIVVVLIDGWGRFIRHVTIFGQPALRAWIFEDTDLVEKEIVQC